MNCIHDNELNNIGECNLLHDRINHYKRTKYINIHYSPNLHGYINTLRGRLKFNIFRNLLYIRCSSMVLIRIQMENLILKNIL